MPPKLPIQPLLAVKLLSWRCSAIQLYDVGSATPSLLSIVHILLVCQESSHRKDRKGVQRMEIRNTPILVHIIHFQSLLDVVYLWYNQPEALANKIL